MDDVKANWAQELSVFQQRPEAIRYGLEYLPTDKAPTVLQFRDLCRRGVVNTTTALPAPSEPASPEVVEKAVVVLKRIRENATGRNWAECLKKREESGERLTQFQRKAWREALKEAQ